MEGERRPLRVPLGEASLLPDGDGLIVEFSLPRGAYATTVLEEIMKSAGYGNDSVSC
jgi:tRNA pseudouridine13 synthase